MLMKPQRGSASHAALQAGSDVFESSRIAALAGLHAVHVRGADQMRGGGAGVPSGAAAAPTTARQHATTRMSTSRFIGIVGKFFSLFLLD
jgi:hypothetical protein